LLPALTIGEFVLKILNYFLFYENEISLQKCKDMRMDGAKSMTGSVRSITAWIKHKNLQYTSSWCVIHWWQLCM